MVSQESLRAPRAPIRTSVVLADGRPAGAARAALLQVAAIEVLEPAPQGAWGAGRESHEEPRDSSRVPGVPKNSCRIPSRSLVELSRIPLKDA